MPSAGRCAATKKIPDLCKRNGFDVAFSGPPTGGWLSVSQDAVGQISLPVLILCHNSKQYRSPQTNKLDFRHHSSKKPIG